MRCFYSRAALLVLSLAGAWLAFPNWKSTAAEPTPAPQPQAAPPAATAAPASTAPPAAVAAPAAAQSVLTVADNVVPPAPAGFRPLGEAHIVAARNRLKDALTDLDQYLSTGAADNAAAWKTHLGWPELQASVGSGAAPNAKAIEALGARFRGGATGLEYWPFTNVRTAIAAYAQAAAIVGDPRQQETHSARVADVQRIAALPKPSADDVAQLGRSLAWLQSADLNPDLVSQVRSRHAQPNLIATVSHRLIDAAMEDFVSDSQAVDDNIMGTEIHGVAHTSGCIGAHPTPSSGRAAIQILLSGVAHSENVGQNRSVTICSTGETTIQACKTLYLDAGGVTADCAHAHCCTSTQITDICAKLRIVEKLAWKQASKKKGQAESIASEHAEHRVAQSMDNRATKLVSEANENYQSKVRAPLERRGVFPQQISLSSTSESLELAAVQSGPDLLAASTPPPAIGGDCDLLLRLHETQVVNLAAQGLADETLTDEKLVQLLQDSGGNVPDELKITPDKDPWSITFVDRDTRPVSVIFADGGFTLTIRGKRFTRADQKITEPMEISAKYKIELTPTGAKGVRQGDVVVDYVKKGGLGVKEVAFKTFLKKKFEALFKPELVGEGINLKGRLAKVGRLQPKELQAQDGWLTIGWKADQTAAKTADAR